MTNHKLACVMVGLPARGKTYIAQKICRYLEWTGTSCRVFNVGQYRRKTAGTNCRSDFFDPKNKDAIALRQEAASMALADMMTWLFQEDGCVAIYDATNTTHERREYIMGVCKENHVDVVFIESICHDPDVIINNIAEVKISGPDYAGMDPEVATEDFKVRMRHYESAYETISENDLAFVKLINVGSLVIVNLIKGWLQSRIVYFLMNLHTQPRRILFSRHGESMYNLKGLLGGDADLSPRGHLYAQSLPSVIRRALGGSADADNLTVWTSTLKRTQQTAAYLRYPKLAWKALDELDAGVCDGMTYEEVEAKYPEDYLERDADKFRYRYRGGESYHDLVVRLEPIIMELERQRNILIIGPQSHGVPAVAPPESEKLKVVTVQLQRLDKNGEAKGAPIQHRILPSANVRHFRALVARQMRISPRKLKLRVTDKWTGRQEYMAADDDMKLVSYYNLEDGQVIDVLDA
ncbi:hypothetical protein AMAG_13622 [Allomyces macrogynus ATCC 38327]|uniref:6-phosphofructo-2-kinase domain-containing protein n=1 Tax=Allomyces macrogynus (strain ATCC 38327) TaxID=578462 RepID=A0A0L0T301_ALLM3|nr:hypothetical protein AMAG_13622 [Allomyces macrogynus ATCC 38327]|eukprot:KNE69238.1 hypothetical protein AMAG_13622 [Allomyces macrogynus ATCC 38327]